MSESVPQLNVEDTIDKILSYLYNDGAYLYNEYQSILVELNIETDRVQRATILNKLSLEELIEMAHVGGWGVGVEPIHRIHLSVKGRKIMDKYKSYKAFILSEDKKEKKQTRYERFDRSIRNGNIIASLLISSIAVVLTQCPTSNSKEQQKIEQGLQSVVKELDSLKQVLRNTQKNTKPPATLDTATKK